MKAYLHKKYGAPQSLVLSEVPKPNIKNNEVLIGTHAVSMNPVDWHVLRGTPYFIRFSTGLFGPKNQSIGADIAGVVEAVGNDVKQFKVGDRVVSDIYSSRNRAFAEYATALEELVVKLPASVSFEDAAALPVAGLTALQGLRDHGAISHGQKVLINGASGGVGTYAVQIAKSFGAEVTAVCKTSNVDMVRSLGADHVIDYTEQDFAQLDEKYDLIFEGVGNKSVKQLKPVLNPGGIVVMVGFASMSKMMKFMIQAPWVARRSSQRMGDMLAKMDRADLSKLLDLLATGKVRSVIDRKYPFAQLREALAYVEEGHTKGKVIVSGIVNSE